MLANEKKFDADELKLVNAAVALSRFAAEKGIDETVDVLIRAIDVIRDMDAALGRRPHLSPDDAARFRDACMETFERTVSIGNAVVGLIYFSVDRTGDAPVIECHHRPEGPITVSDVFRYAMHRQGKENP